MNFPKRWSPYFTWLRFAIALSTVVALFSVVHAFAPERMPTWMHEWRTPLWFANHWVLWVSLSAFFVLTGAAYRLDWMKLPPLPEPTEYPDRPDLSTSELYDFVDRDEDVERKRRRFLEARSRAAGRYQ